MLIATIIFIALQVLDAVLTKRIISAGGRELNPFMAWLQRKFGGWTWLLIPKLIGCVFIVTLVVMFSYWTPMLWIVIGLDVFYGYICWRNWRVLKSS
jgi:hypothetical protein